MNKNLMDMIKKHEGFRSKPYICTAGKMTIGYGRNIEDIGISEQEATFLIKNDINRSIIELEFIFSDFNTFSENRQNALIDMIFNLGSNRFNSFKKMIKAINKNDWNEASIQAENSKWHNQVKNRALTIERLLKHG